MAAKIVLEPIFEADFQPCSYGFRPRRSATQALEEIRLTGGRGHYLGMLGGVLLLTALQMLLAGTTLPYATRAILYGLVVLGAVMALRERRLQ